MPRIRQALFRDSQYPRPKKKSQFKKLFIVQYHCQKIDNTINLVLSNRRGGGKGIADRILLTYDGFFVLLCFVLAWLLTPRAYLNLDISFSKAKQSLSLPQKAGEAFHPSMHSGERIDTDVQCKYFFLDINREYNSKPPTTTHVHTLTQRYL